jgi:hypothetical protein
MSFNHSKAGPNSVPSYQLSGVPYLTGSRNSAGTPVSEVISASRFDFPQVTRFITFSVSSGNGDRGIHVAFSKEGISNISTAPSHVFIVPAGGIATLDVRCKSVWVSTSGSACWSLCAGLTPISAADFPVLTGSNGFYGIGGAVSGSIDGLGW